MTLLEQLININIDQNDAALARDMINCETYEKFLARNTGMAFLFYSDACRVISGRDARLIANPVKVWL